VVGWLSLDRDDNQPQLFWSYLIAALRTVLPDVGAGMPAFAGGCPAGRGRHPLGSR